MAKIVNNNAFKRLQKLVDDLPSALNKKVTQALADQLKAKVLDLVSKGISPLEGKRFPSYKDPKKYPALARKKFPDKRARPVNLSLSGVFLNSLKSIGTDRGISFGFTDPLSKKKEQGHRQGANGQPKRPIIPPTPAEFSSTIRLLLLNGLKKAVQEAVKRRK